MCIYSIRKYSKVPTDSKFSKGVKPLPPPVM